MSDTSDSEHINDIVLDEPMFYILTQFLETRDGRNIATVLDELCSEIKALRVSICQQKGGSSLISTSPPPPISSTLASPSSAEGSN